jgi:UDP-N-acetylglucosamine 2-epimerase
VRKVCIFIGSRANYSSIKSVMRAVKEHPDLRLQLVVGASALLDRFGSVVDVIEADGFTPDARVTMIVEGERRRRWPSRPAWASSNCRPCSSC